MKNEEGTYRIAGEKLEVNSLIYIDKNGKVYRAKRPTFFQNIKEYLKQLFSKK